MLVLRRQTLQCPRGLNVELKRAVALEVKKVLTKQEMQAAGTRGRRSARSQNGYGGGYGNYSGGYGAVPRSN
ncbi:unnamed protein product, partial [Coregonus sp. 'balchen']